MSEEIKENKLCSKVEECYHLMGKKWTGLIIHTLMEDPKGLVKSRPLSLI